MKKYLIILIIFLNFCTTTTPPSTSDLIIQKIKDAGLVIYDIEYNSWYGEKDKKVGNLYDSGWYYYSERVHFTIGEVAPRGGQFIICKTVRECNDVWNHYDTFRGLAGPYVYRSKDKKLIAQLNSGLSVESGKLFGNIFDNLDNTVVTDR